MINGGEFSRPPFSPRPTRLPELCYKCFDEQCVYNIIQCAFIIGIAADVIVIWRVIVDRKLRNETFVAISCLALCDALFLSMNIVSVFSQLAQMAFCVRGTMVTNTMAWALFQGITWFAAASHVSLISLVRFTILTYPLKYKRWVTTKRIIIVSGILWLLGGFIFGVIEIIQMSTGVRVSDNLALLLTLWCIVYGVPVVTTLIAHVAKVYNVRKTTRDSGALSDMSETAHMQRQMLIMILVVIVLATILPMPRLVQQIMRSSGNTFSTTVSVHQVGISYSLYLMNFAINPFVYAFMSVAFRQSLKQICRRRSGWVGDVSYNSRSA